MASSPIGTANPRGEISRSSWQQTSPVPLSPRPDHVDDSLRRVRLGRFRVVPDDIPGASLGLVQDFARRGRARGEAVAPFAQPGAVPPTPCELEGAGVLVSARFPLGRSLRLFIARSIEFSDSTGSPRPFACHARRRPSTRRSRRAYVTLDFKSLDQVIRAETKVPVVADFSRSFGGAGFQGDSSGFAALKMLRGQDDRMGMGSDPCDARLPGSTALAVKLREHVTRGSFVVIVPWTRPARDCRSVSHPGGVTRNRRRGIAEQVGASWSEWHAPVAREGAPNSRPLTVGTASSATGQSPSSTASGQYLRSDVHRECAKRFYRKSSTFPAPALNNTSS